MHELKNIIRYLHGLLSHPEETWTRLSDPECKGGELEYMYRHYYAPLLGLGCVLIFLLHGNGVMLHSRLEFDAPFSIEYAIKGVVSFALSFMVGPVFARLVIEQLYTGLTRIQLVRQKLDVFVTYNTSVVMLIYLFCACFPYFTFLQVSGLYIIYIVYLGVDFYLQIQIARGLFLTWAVLAIYFCPWLIRFVLAMFIQ